MLAFGCERLSLLQGQPSRSSDGIPQSAGFEFVAGGREGFFEFQWGFDDHRRTGNGVTGGTVLRTASCKVAYSEVGSLGVNSKWHEMDSVS